MDQNKRTLVKIMDIIIVTFHLIINVLLISSLKTAV